MKILVGSENPVKIKAVEEAFSKFFKNIEVEGIKVNSGVSSQPIGEEETFRGAKNRVLKLREIAQIKNLEVDFFVGIEGGVINLFSRWFAFGAVCISNKEGKFGFGTSSLFELPQQIVSQLLNGNELGVVIDRIFRTKDIKKREGAIGIFTKGVISRKDLYIPAIIIALIPFLNEDLFFGRDEKYEKKEDCR